MWVRVEPQIIQVNHKIIDCNDTTDPNCREKQLNNAIIKTTSLIYNYYIYKNLPEGIKKKLPYNQYEKPIVETESELQNLKMNENDINVKYLDQLPLC